MCVVPQNVESGEVVGNLQCTVLASEELAFIGPELMLQSLSPFGHGAGVVSRDLAQVGAKARLCCLARCLWATSGYTLRHIVSSTHERDQDHALAI